MCQWNLFLNTGVDIEQIDGLLNWHGGGGVGGKNLQLHACVKGKIGRPCPWAGNTIILMSTPAAKKDSITCITDNSELRQNVMQKEGGGGEGHTHTHTHTHTQKKAPLY